MLACEHAFRLSSDLKRYAVGVGWMLDETKAHPHEKAPEQYVVWGPEQGPETLQQAARYFSISWPSVRDQAIVGEEGSSSGLIQQVSPSSQGEV